MTSAPLESHIWSALVARFDGDGDGALSFNEFQALVADLLAHAAATAGRDPGYGTAAEVAAQISSWTGFAGAEKLAPEHLFCAFSEGTPFGPLQPALVAARDTVASELAATAERDGAWGPSCCCVDQESTLATRTRTRTHMCTRTCTHTRARPSQRHAA